MKIDVYKQTFSEKQGNINISKEDIEFGFTSILCPDCDGTGIFELEDDNMICISCKGSGKLFVSLI